MLKHSALGIDADIGILFDLWTIIARRRQTSGCTILMRSLTRHETRGK